MSLRGAVFGTTILTRDEIGLRPPRFVTDISRPVDTTAHYAGLTDWDQPGVDRSTPERFRVTTDHGLCPAIVRAHQAYHMDERGWSDYAYSGSACPHGFGLLGRGPDVRTAANGTTEGNDTSLALQYLGAGPGDPLTVEAMRAFIDMAVLLRFALKRGHRDHKPTACPGDIVYDWRLAGFPYPEDDMAIADEVWDHPVLDVIDLEHDGRGQLVPAHQLFTWLHMDNWRGNQAVLAKLDVIIAKLAGLDVDEDAIAAAVLAGMPVEAIAEAIPATHAEQVALLIGQKLVAGSEVGP